MCICKPAKLLVLPVIRPPSWISGAHRRPTKSEVPPLESLTRKHGSSCWNYVAVCSRTRDMPGSIFSPSPSVAGTSQKQESPAVADKPARRLRKVRTVYVRAVGL